MLCRICVRGFVLNAAFLTVTASVWAFSSEVNNRIPDEYESVGDHSLGLDNAGMAATGGLAAIRLNPGMLPMETQYSISGGYHWPTQGREFYQAGVVDSKTSSVAAGFLYTSFIDPYKAPELTSRQPNVDSPVVRRGNLALAKSFKKLSLGVSGQFVEANLPPDSASNVGAENQTVKGTSLGLGAAALVLPALRVGVSAESLANRKIADYAPRTFRVGAAYIMARGDITAHLDFRQRDRVEAFEAPLVDVTAPSNEDYADELAKHPEQLLIGSFSARVYDLVRILGGYGQDLGEDRRSFAGGVAIVSDQMALSYTASRPDLRSPTAHQAVNLSLRVAM